MNLVYLYDGSFQGLLTIVFDSYVSSIMPNAIYPEDNYEPNLLETVKYIDTDYEKAERIFNGVVKNISYSTLYNTYYAFLSNIVGRELAIVQYLVKGFSLGPKIETMLSIDYVWLVQTARKHMLGEAHRLKGLLRFQEVGDNLFYSSIHPDNNVIEDLGHHFIRRLPTQNFMIHDKIRNLVLLYNTKEYKILPAENMTIPSITETEKKYQKLWKTFFETIAIKERTNSRLQMQFMPKKYWQDLVEKNVKD